MQSIPRLKMKQAPAYAGGGIAKLQPKTQRYADGGTTTQIVTNLPEYAQGAYADLVGRAQAQSQVPYQGYQGERVAQFTPLQQQGFQGIAGLGTSGYTQQAGGLAALASQQAMNSYYNPASVQTYGSSPLQVSAGPGPQQVGTYGQAPMMTNTQSFTQPGTAGQYMNPYMQSVVDVQQRNAIRADDVARGSRNAQAVGAGAFGGSRQAIQESEAAKNLATQLGDIQATGSNAAFQQAQQQFNAEQNARLQSQTANQQAGLNFGNQYLQAGLANQQAGLSYGAQNLTAQQANQQAGLNFGSQYLDAQKLAEASRQFGASYGLQGLQTGLQGAGTLGTLGNNQFQQQYSAAQAQGAAGLQQQQQVQAMLDAQYNQYQQQQQYPYQQLGFMSDILRGTQGTSKYSTSTDTAAQPSNMQNLIGLGTALYGASKSGLFAEGGGIASIAPDSVGEFADGGIIGYADGGRTLPYTDDSYDASGRKKGSGLWELLTPSAGKVTMSGPRPSDQLIPQMSGNYAEPRERFGNLYATSQDTPARERDAVAPTVTAPVAAPAAPKSDVIDLGGIDKTDTGGGIGIGVRGGGAEAVRIGAPKARTMEEMLASQKAAGRDIDAYERIATEARTKAGEADVAAAKGDEQALTDFYAKQGIAGVAREKRLRDELADLPKEKEMERGTAFLDAGLRILAADPSRGWLAAVGTGAIPALKEHGVNMKQLQARQDKLNDSLESLDEARRQEANAQGLQLLSAQSATRKAETAAKKNLYSLTETIGLQKYVKDPDVLWGKFEDEQRDARQRQTQVDIANASNATHAAVANARVTASGAGGGKPITDAQYVAAIQKATAGLAKDPKYLGKDPTVIRAAAKQAVDADIAAKGLRVGSQYDLTGASFSVRPDAE